MNQHITKLVRQALKESVSTPVESVVASRIDDHGIVEIPNTFAEKFAELIVRECAEFRNELGIALCTDPSALYRYFGVEEVEQ